MEKDFKGVWIPKEVWLDKKLTLAEKCYLALYIEYHNIKIVDSLIKPVYSKQTFIKARHKLIKLNYIKDDKTDNAEHAKQIVIENKNKGITCEWCGVKTNAIQEHHYPLTKAQGGKNIVKICPNCHSEFHLIFKGE